MKKCSFLLLTFLQALSFTTLNASFNPECIKIDLNNYSIYSFYSVGESIGNCENYGSAGLFYAPCIRPCNFNAQFDFAYNYYDDGRFGASGGTGFRYVNSSNTMLGGFHFFYDYREGTLGNYNQIGVNLEIIGNCFELRANGYIPVGDVKNKGPFEIYSDYDDTDADLHYVVTSFREEFAMSGLDVEGGLKYCCDELIAYAGIGSYYFERDPYIDLWGAFGKVRFQYGRSIALEGQVTWDSVLKTEGRVRFELNIPFSSFCSFWKALTCFCKSQTRIYRDSPVHLRGCCQYTANY